MKITERSIGELAVFALRAELSATVKPGLVDRLNSGAHKDMDYSIMSAGISALAPWFTRFAETGASGGLVNFAELREAGKQAEADMLAATGGVNTHRGAIFSVGLCAACAAGIAKAGNQELSDENVCRLAAETVRGLELRRDDASQRPLSNGEKVYRKYGVSGARAEAESGFATARFFGLPALREALRAGITDNDAHVQAIISLMSKADDSNVLSRSNPSRAAALKLEAHEILENGGVYTAKGRDMILGLDRRLIAEGISPGGSADLLALCVFLNGLGGLA